VNVLPMGERAMLVVELADPVGWAIGLRSLELDGVVDVVPAAETVLITCTDAAALRALGDVVADVVPSATGADLGEAVTIPVRYDGADLAEVAAAAGLTVATVIELHSTATYVAGFCGFSPGFAYLRGLPPVLQLPRRSTPRTSVPAGSVAIASEYAAVYPRTSPGGWHLLGTTDAVVFDPAAQPPALFQPGTRVRFVPA
jgi:KipI family sensor histidine kinase inhibitor